MGQAVEPVSQEVPQHQPHNGNCSFASGMLEMGKRVCVLQCGLRVDISDEASF
jgi:hypothetical protein